MRTNTSNEHTTPKLAIEWVFFIFLFWALWFQNLWNEEGPKPQKKQTNKQTLKHEEEEEAAASILRTQLCRTNTNTTKQNWRAQRRENRQSTHQRASAPPPTTTKLWTPISAAGISVTTATATKETRRPAHKQQQHTIIGELSRPDSSRFFWITKFFLAFLWLFIDFSFVLVAWICHRAFGETPGDFYGAFYWVVLSFFFPFPLPASECFFGLRGCAEAFAETRGDFFGHFCVSLFLEFHLLQWVICFFVGWILPTPLLNGVPSFIWAFLWLFIGPFFKIFSPCPLSDFFWLRGFAAGFGFFFPLSKRLKISNLG